MDRPFLILLSAGVVIAFGTAWVAAGGSPAPLPPPVVAAAPAEPGNPHPDAASSLTVPVSVDRGGSSAGSSATPFGQPMSGPDPASPIGSTPAPEPVAPAASSEAARPAPPADDAPTPGTMPALPPPPAPSGPPPPPPAV